VTTRGGKKQPARKTTGIDAKGQPAKTGSHPQQTEREDRKPGGGEYKGNSAVGVWGASSWRGKDGREKIATAWANPQIKNEGPRPQARGGTEKKGTQPQGKETQCTRSLKSPSD